MFPPGPTISLAEWLALLAQEIPTQQARLDADYLARLDAYLPVLQQARAAGYEKLARALAPTALAVNDTEMTLRLRVAHSTEQQLQVQFFGLGFARRYGHAETAQHTLALRVERIPLDLSPGALPPASS